MGMQTMPEGSAPIPAAQRATPKSWTLTEFVLDPLRKQHTQSEANAASVQAYFESEAPFWRSIYARNDVYAIIYQDRQAAVLSQVDRLVLPAAAKVLDIGCGAGLTSVSLAQRGFIVNAIDVAPAMLAQTKRLAKDSGVEQNVRTSEGDVRHLPFPDGMFHLVIALGVLPWLHALDGPMQEMARVLRNGGYLIITVDNRWRLHELADPFAWLWGRGERGRKTRRAVAFPSAKPTRLCYAPACGRFGAQHWDSGRFGSRTTAFRDLGAWRYTAHCRSTSSVASRSSARQVHTISFSP